MSSLKAIFDSKNMNRAYRWLLSNPDAQYKSFFRDSYDSFAFASATHIEWLRKECLSDRYQPANASKVLVPKPSGALRPITLLTVEDQLVYQACINIVADGLRKKTKKRYHKRVFAHLFAGTRSKFFYYQWQNSYSFFGKSIKKAYADGYRDIADFDLASFYDSIDHFVLKHFLKETGIDEDAVEFLLRCLRQWTSSTWSDGPSNIYHEHGIPQGPLASGMLSETVLQHIDAIGEKGRKTRYLRYVDDIKILAKSESDLREKLIGLDIAAKQIGLFPQTAKINIHRMTDPRAEIKSVSQPPEPSVVPRVKQEKLVSRVLEITRRGQVNSKLSSRFKYLLANAIPTHKLNSRLFLVLRNHPELAPAICSYFNRYDKLPSKAADEIVKYLKERELYHSVHGALLRAVLGRLPTAQTNTLGNFCRHRLLTTTRNSPRPQPTYKESLIAWCLSARTISFAEYDRIVSEENDWWVRKSAIRELSSDQFGPASYSDFVNRQMRVTDGEVSRSSAARLIQDKIILTRPYGDVEMTAKQTLKAAKIVKAVGQPESRINEIFAYILTTKQTKYDWKKLFGSDHRHAEHMAIIIKRNRESNIDAFLVQLDSFFDFLARKIYPRFKPGITCPVYGAVLRDPNLIAVFPFMFPTLLKLHDLRLASITAHPVSKHTGKPTRRLKHHDFHKIRKDLITSLQEFERVVVP